MTGWETAKVTSILAPSVMTQMCESGARSMETTCAQLIQRPPTLTRITTTPPP